MKGEKRILVHTQIHAEKAISNDKKRTKVMPGHGKNKEEINKNQTTTTL